MRLVGVRTVIGNSPGCFGCRRTRDTQRDIFSAQLVYIGCGKCGEADSTVINHAAVAEFWGTTANNQLTGDF